ncbi:MAG: tetratricopeptide repeat protein [Candidatus Zixiibacteriota bacterium]|nr:MAG: tetratricopeptide repeat protein [candidate division Zixibacteria bacterium]
MSRFNRFAILVALIAFFSGCVYYNTFYLARKSFNEAESKRKELARGQSARGLAGMYKKAIEKSDKVLEKHPNSKWFDDALYVNGVSHFYLENYIKSERRFRELIANFPESKYVKDARVYLAMSKLELGDVADAMVLFEELYSESREKEIKAKAALALGEYYFGEKDYEAAKPYFRSLIDSLGSDEDRLKAQAYLADGEFARFNFNDALAGYEEILDMEADTREKFRAHYRIGECYYSLGDIEAGLETYNYLAEDEMFYDSLGAVKLMIAWGYELDGDLVLAEDVYKEVAVEYPRKKEGAIANFSLGLIYQYDYEDYKKAKEYYDKAKTGGAASGIYQEALQRSTDIGKLEEYSRRQEFDTTATQEDFDNAALTQYLLAELYVTQLSKPDSALQEFQYIMDDFPETYIAPKAMIATALLYRDYYDDTLSFDTTLRAVLRDYPRSDHIPEAIDLLGLAGTRADTGYAESFYKRAEYFLFDEQNLDSARYYLQLVIDSFPRSYINVQARYAKIWLTETYDPPGDSSVYYAYSSFLDSFPRDDFTTAAEKKIRLQARPKRQIFEDVEDSTVVASGETEGDSTAAADSTYLTPEEKYYIDADGNKIYNVQESPIKVDKEFRYPPAAYYLDFEGYLYVQVRIDAFGDIIDARLMNPTPSEELNEEVMETVYSSHFNTGWIPPELFDTWFVYKYYIQLPSSLR